MFRNHIIQALFVFVRGPKMGWRDDDNAFRYFR